MHFCKRTDDKTSKTPFQLNRNTWINLRELPALHFAGWLELFSLANAGTHPITIKVVASHKSIFEMCKFVSHLEFGLVKNWAKKRSKLVP